MANSLVSFRMNNSMKEESEKICETIGIDLQTYLRICVARLVKEGGIPFAMNDKSLNK